jgi:hypothetical protein
VGASRPYLRGQDTLEPAGEDAGATLNLAADGGWDEDELFALVTRGYPYRNLSRETYNSILEMLAEGIASRRGRYGAYIHNDRVNRRLRILPRVSLPWAPGSTGSGPTACGSSGPAGCGDDP